MMRIYTAAKKIAVIMLAGMLVTAAVPQEVYAEEAGNETSMQNVEETGDAKAADPADNIEETGNVKTVDGIDGTDNVKTSDGTGETDNVGNVDDTDRIANAGTVDDTDGTDNTGTADDTDGTDNAGTVDDTDGTDNAGTADDTDGTDNAETPGDTEGTGGTLPDGTTDGEGNLPGEIPGDPGGSIGGSSVFYQEDPATGIIADAAESVFPAWTMLYVTPVESGDAYDQIGTLMNMIADQFKVYDIRFVNMLDQSMTEPAGTVKISIPVPDGYDTEHLSVSRLGEDGTRTEMSFEIADGKAVFETDAAGTFLVAQMKVLPDSLEMTEKTERVELTKRVPQQTAVSAVSKTSLQASPKTGDDTDAAVWGGLMAAAVVVFLVFVVIKRKK